MGRDPTGSAADLMSDFNRTRWRAVAGAAVAVLLFTGWTLRLIPLGDVLSATQPTGYDLGPHLYAFDRGASRILAGQSPLGWDDGWFAGFPLFYFYFPFPALLLALLRLPVHAHVAMKLVSLMGVLLLPTAAYLFGRRATDSRLVGVGTAAGAVLFLETQSFHNLGGNLASVLAGEFSYSIGFTLSVFLAACVVRPTRGREIIAVALLLAATVLSHLIPGFVAVLLIAVAAGTHRSKLRWLGSVYGLGFLVAAFWAVPFLAHRDLFWHGVTFSAFPVTGLAPLELLIPFPLALVGIYALRSSRTALAMVMVIAMTGPLLLVLPQPYVHPGRLVPYWFLAVHLLAGIGLGFAAERVAREPTRSVVIRALPAVIPVLLLVEFRSGRELRTWAEWNYSGVEEKAAWPELARLHEAIGALPPGRVHWEAEARYLSRFGTPNALMLIPYHDPAHPVLAGLWRESSPTAAFIPVADRTAQRVSELAAAGSDTEAVVRRLRHQLCTLGVRYFAVHRPWTRNALSDELEEVAATQIWAVFELPNCGLVDVMAGPLAMVDRGEFLDRATTWFDSAGPGWIVQGKTPPALGPDAAAPDSDAGSRTELLEHKNGSIRFRTPAAGVPHLVRVSYFPDWKVEGGRGPYRAGPNFMVVVPTASEVRLVFRAGWAERTGWALTALALMGLVVLVVWIGWRDNAVRLRSTRSMQRVSSPGPHRSRRST